MRPTLTVQLFVAAVIAAAPAAAIAKDHKGGPHGKAGKHEAKIEKREARLERRDRDVDRDRDRRPRAIVREDGRRRDVVVLDRDGERRIVTEFFNREGLPPGLAKRRSLPPGLAKHLRERGQLPPGLQKRLTPVPGPLVARFSGPPYYSRYFAGRDLVIVDRRTNTVAAIIPNALPR